MTDLLDKSVSSDSQPSNILKDPQNKGHQNSAYNSYSGQPFENNRFLNLLQGSEPLEPHANSKRKKVKHSKLPIKAVVLSGNYSKASELHKKGFALAPSLIFDSISKMDSEAVNNIINHSLYSSANLDLAFWSLLESGLASEAKNLWQIESYALGAYCNEGAFSSLVTSEEVLSDPKLIKAAFEQALNFGLDDWASRLLRRKYDLLTIDHLITALENGCVNLLKIVWSGDLTTDPSLISNLLFESELWTHIEQTNSTVFGIKETRSLMKPYNIFSLYLSNKRFKEAREMMAWPMLKNNYSVLDALIESENSQLACEYILATSLKVNTEKICQALYREKYEICYAMLKVMQGKIENLPSDLQKVIVTMIDKSDACLLAAEILNRLAIRSWNFEYTRDLCLTLNSSLKKKQSIVYCPSPLLYCVLIARVMDKFGNFSSRFRYRCQNTKDLYLEFGVFLQDNLGDEESLKYYMTEKDSRGVTVLEIIANEKFYELLNNDDVGIMITKLWRGSESYYSLHKSSSIVTTVLAPFGSEESMQFSQGINKTKPYSFQLVRWKDAPSSRFVSFSLAILIMIVLYHILLYRMIYNSSVLDMKKGDYEVGIFGIIVTLILGISCEQILAILYSLKTKGTVNIDMWKVIDWIIALLVIFISLEVPLKYYENGWAKFESAYLASGIIHSIMLCLLVMKLWHLSMTSSTFGPFLSMTLLIFKEIFTFFVIFCGFGLCSAAIFMLLFKTTDGYGGLDLSLRTLYMATIGPFTINNFKENKVAFGAVVLAIFLLISHILLLNLLVGIVTNVFNQFQTRIASEYRSVLIKTYYDNLWNDQCGILILVPTPLNSITLLLSPFVLYKDGEKWNRIFVKVLFSLYTLPYYVIFIVVSMAAIPVAYLEGFVIYGRTGRQVEEEKPIKIFNIPDDGEINYVKKFSYLKFFLWTIIGPFWLLFAFFRDCIQFWQVAYLETPGATDSESQSTDQSFIKVFQKSLNSLSEDSVSTETFLKTFTKFDKLINEQTEIHEERTRANIERFSNQLHNKNLEIPQIKKLFPKVIGGEYNEEYTERFSQFRLFGICKGLNNFQRKIGSTENLRKMKMNKEGTSAKFYEEIEKVENIVQTLKSKAEDLIRKCEDLAGISDNESFSEG